MRLERVFVPVLVLLLCGLLAFLTFWRVDNFGAKGRWSEFVESSPAVIKDASARVETVSSFIKEATEAGFKPEDINDLKESADEVDVLTRKLSPVLDFLTEIDESGSDMDILAAVSKQSSTVQIEIPADFKAQHERLRSVRLKLQAKSDALLEQVNGLLLEFSGERKRLDTGWTDARTQLSQTMDEAQEVLDLSYLYILDSERNRASLESAMGRAQTLLDAVKSRPAVFSEADAQIASYKTAMQKVSDAAEALNAEMVEIDNRPVIIEPEPEPEPVPVEEEDPDLLEEEPSPSPTQPPVVVEPSPTPTTGGGGTGGGDTEEPVDPDPNPNPDPDPEPEPEPRATVPPVEPVDPITGQRI